MLPSKIVNLTSYVYAIVRALHTILILLLATSVDAQIINNAISYRSIKDKHYVRHDYENDYFSATDRFYTQGINMEVVIPKFKKLPTSVLLLHPKSYTVQYGVALQHNAYTPSKITDSNIRFGDRPYASSAMLQAFTISTNEAKR